MNEYLKADGVCHYGIPRSWVQVFYYPFGSPNKQNEALVLRTFLESLTPEEEKTFGRLLLFLYRHPFALKEQLEDCFGKREGKNPESLSNLLDFGLREHFLNCFTFAEEPMEEFPKDALRIYCLDHASRYVLGHFYKEDVLYTWNRFRAVQAGPDVSRSLLLNDLYLELSQKGAECVKDMAAPLSFYYNHRSIFFHGGFYVKKNDRTREYLVEVVRGEDLPESWREKVSSQIAPFFSERNGREQTEPNWRRYFLREPAVLLFGDSLENLSLIGALYERGTGKSLYRLCLISDVKKGLEGIRLYRYQRETGKVEATDSTALQLVM